MAKTGSYTSYITFRYIYGKCYLRSIQKRSWELNNITEKNSLENMGHYSTVLFASDRKTRRCKIIYICNMQASYRILKWF